VAIFKTMHKLFDCCIALSVVLFALKLHNYLGIFCIHGNEVQVWFLLHTYYCLLLAIS